MWHGSSERAAKRAIMSRSAGEYQDDVAVQRKQPAAKAVTSGVNKQVVPKGYSTTRAASTASFTSRSETSTRTPVASSPLLGHDTTLQLQGCGVRKTNRAEQDPVFRHQSVTTKGTTNASTHPRTVSLGNSRGVDAASFMTKAVRTPRRTTVAAALRPNSDDATEEKVQSVETPNSLRNSSRPPLQADPVTTFGRKLYVEAADTDVLFGRGRAHRGHPGNKRMKELVDHHRKEYDEASRDDKTDLAWNIVSIIHSERGRFLKRDKSNTNRWYEVPDEAAREKVSHALRDSRPKLRAEATMHPSVEVDSLLVPSSSNLVTTTNPSAISTRPEDSQLNTTTTTTGQQALTSQIANLHREFLPSFSYPSNSSELWLLWSLLRHQSHQAGDDNNGSAGFFSFC